MKGITMLIVMFWTFLIGVNLVNVFSILLKYDFNINAVFICLSGVSLGATMIIFPERLASLYQEYRDAKEARQRLEQIERTLFEKQRKELEKWELK